MQPVDERLGLNLECVVLGLVFFLHRLVAVVPLQHGFFGDQFRLVFIERVDDRLERRHCVVVQEACVLNSVDKVNSVNLFDVG